MEWRNWMETAESAAREAGAILKAGSGNLREVAFEDARDVKLKADTESEALTFLPLKAVAAESAFKYFLMGAFVSTFVVLGIALLYGETGTTQLDEISRRLASGDFSTVPVTLGFLLLAAGFGFKMSIVPFHAWAPDTYQGDGAP